MECKGRIEGLMRDIVSGRITMSLILESVNLEELNNLRDKDLRIKASRWTNKRSLSANAYFHVLVNKIAGATTQSRFRVKNTLIARYGQPELVDDEAVVYKTNAPEDYMLELESIHSYPCKYEEQNGKTVTFYKIYRGSHTYNTQEMSQLIDGTIIEAKELGIETLPPAELEQMMERWKDDISKDGKV